MSNRELQTEAIRLINEIDADRMEDLVLSIRAFKEQQDIETDIDPNSPELLKQLNESLRQLEAGQFISNEDVLKEIKRGLRDKMESSRQGKLL